MRRNEKEAGTSCGTYGWEKIPRFGKDKMATFERYFWKMRKAIKEKKKSLITGCLKK